MKKHGKLKIEFKNGRADTWEPEQWDDWIQTDVTLTVKKGREWVAVYNVTDLKGVYIE